MVGKQIKGKDFYGVLKYNQNKVDIGEAIVLESNLSSESVVKQTKEFNIIRQQKPNLSKAVYHVSLNLPYNDANKLSNHEFSNLARDYLVEMGFEDNQFIVYKHFDVDHSHIHIVANRVSFSGNVVSDSQDYKRSEALIRKLELKYKLTELVRKEQSNVLSKGEIEKCLRTGDVPERLQLQKIIADILLQKVTLEEFQERLKKQKVMTKLNKSSTGNISGISFEFKNTTYKGSKVHRSLSWNNITKKLINNEQKRDHNAISTINIKNREDRKEAIRVVRATEPSKQSNNRESEDNLFENKANEINNKPKFRFRR